MSKKSLIAVFTAICFAIIISCSTTTLTVKIEPKNYNFGQVNIGTTATFDFVISNKKSVDVTITVINFSTNEFRELGNSVGTIISAKGFHTITVEFAPTLPGGVKNDTMHISWSDTNQKTGVFDVNLKGESVPVANISVTPTTHDFGIVLVGANTSHNFNIENAGTADLILSSLIFNGNATSYSITAGGAVPVTVIPGATHTITVRFAPLVDGSLPTVLEITHNAINAATPATITITGEGTTHSPGIAVNRTSTWDFGLVMTNANSTEDLQIESNGLHNLLVSSLSFSTGTAFSIASVKSSGGNNLTLPTTVNVGDYIEVTVQFSPTTNDVYPDTLNIVHDATNTGSPLRLEVEGEGRNPITQTFNYTGSIADWTVPGGVTTITIEGWGAEGGQAAALGGKGARMKGNFTVNPGELIKVVVAQQGDRARYTTGPGGGGGGGSFVWRNTSTTYPLIAAGGGGGGGNSTGYDGVTDTAGVTVPGSGTGGTNGNGGTSSGENCAGSGGAGWVTKGQDQSCAGSYWNYGGATKFSFAGGQCTYTASGGGSYGGFGGGGAALRGGAGAGGYSGGGGGRNSTVQGGGGGGSYNSGTNQSNSAGVKTSNGQGTITY